MDAEEFIATILMMGFEDWSRASNVTYGTIYVWCRSGAPAIRVYVSNEIRGKRNRGIGSIGVKSLVGKGDSIYFDDKVTRCNRAMDAVVSLMEAIREQGGDV